jgi:hypothetical protein
MPYDPALPANNSPVSSAELRSQLAGLNDNIVNGLADLAANTVPNAQYQVDYSNTARNFDGTLTRLEMVVSDPPTQAEVQAIADKIDQLIDALRRP